MKIKKEVKIGIYLVAAVVVLYWGLNFLKGRDVFGNSNKYYAVFDNVQGLQQTSSVFLRGLKVGMVEKIIFDEESNNFKVTLSVDSKYNIPLETKAVIYSVDLLGSKAVKLELGVNRLSHVNGDLLKSEIEGDLINTLSTELIPIKDTLNTVLEKASKTLSAINNILDEEGTENLSKAIGNFRSITENLKNVSHTIDELLLQEKGSIANLINNVEGFTANLKNNEENITAILSNLAQVSESFAEANFGEIAGSINDILTKLKSGEGSLGKILSDDSLYTNLVSTTNSLNALLEDLKENPNRYVHISVFGKKSKN